jgi:hypothetical protein
MADFTTRAFNSFSGADIKAVFAGVEIGNLMAVSYAIQREKAPIYVLGEANPRAFSRGKRGIAGSLIFIQFDQHAILETFNQSTQANLGNFVKKKYEISPDQLSQDDAALSAIAGSVTSNPSDLGEISQAFYADQIPAFDVNIAAANEYGITAKCAIHGVELMNEGWGMGIEDRQADMQTTYLARAVTKWTTTKQIGQIERHGSGAIIKPA